MLHPGLSPTLWRVAVPTATGMFTALNEDWSLSPPPCPLLNDGLLTDKQDYIIQCFSGAENKCGSRVYILNFFCNYTLRWIRILKGGVGPCNDNEKKKKSFPNDPNISSFWWCPCSWPPATLSSPSPVDNNFSNKIDLRILENLKGCCHSGLTHHLLEELCHSADFLSSFNLKVNIKITRSLFYWSLLTDTSILSHKC